ncbi:TIGR03854 family LLM class F420-dependent oxidoreductase [Mycobacterium sp. CVI_P3]|uniref:TIGR03854 family LLM class F420-dependent oxidoreductase n=1 Tax=Mycobacterium pinniadriaticum TaxID=2994102 RepID=A0ABT3S947_9MYCO|nr:TIGR03854 family LLM class F420-dependent oxidoreductase [Mycobacterium pinniadriaticum]MCX2929590.1 TIGR03854 family LLM class F420-dependent oxidoreductase [Mycobacterium pinniadriaticum]MCX2936014.1 TIGR03854 family LLM class F420-dependent oxidoreductase [Mycobacterium pinniadriaticum]
MKIRFGASLGLASEVTDLPRIVDRLESAGVDSLWFSELVYSPAVDPFAGMAYTLGRADRLKVGTSVAVLPGRNPVLVAKALASLAALGPKRVLPAFGLRPASQAEWNLFGVPDGRRAAVFDEALEVLRALLTGDEVTFAGEFFQLTSASLGICPPVPVDIWLGGSAPAAFRRIGRLADGWLGSFLTPDEAGAARESIERAAAEAGRAIEPDHYGLSLGVADGGLRDEIATAVRSRRPDVDPADLVAGDWPQLHRQLDGLIAAGLSKFVIRPVGDTPADEFIDRFIDELLPRQN